MGEDDKKDDDKKEDDKKDNNDKEEDEAQPPPADSEEVPDNDALEENIKKALEGSSVVEEETKKHRDTVLRSFAIFIRNLTGAKAPVAEPKDDDAPAPAPEDDEEANIAGKGVDGQNEESDTFDNVNDIIKGKDKPS